MGPIAEPGERDADWLRRVEVVVSALRELGVPEETCGAPALADRFHRIVEAERVLLLSRSGLDFPSFRIRVSKWDRLEARPGRPVQEVILEGGVLGTLVYGDRPRIIDDLRLGPDDPAAPLLVGQQSLLAVPGYERGSPPSMTVLTHSAPCAFRREELADHVWMCNLFEAASDNLELAERLRQTHDLMDREFKLVADIQRSLLPRDLPSVLNLELAVHYQTSHWAGGDYYDFFPLPGGRWGFLVADVSGHGTPAAVVMAITHSIAHGLFGPADPPDALLAHINRELASRYTSESGTFVTAFYAVFDSSRRELAFARAGHNPPRLRRARGGELVPLEGYRSYPLGVSACERYESTTEALEAGDQLILYTDGITEACDPSGFLFGSERLDAALRSGPRDAPGMVRAVLECLEKFTEGRRASDDRTLLVARVL
jgi:sigma-B regulation protein RsbU (phosphoserine phosphatase)